MPMLCTAGLLVVSVCARQGLALRSMQEPAAIPVSEAEHEQTVPCSFVDERGEPAICPIEKPEHILVEAHVESQSTGVLELGGRYGTTTCEIAKKIGNSGRVVAVEPDSNVWAAHEKNMASHNCRAHLVKGIVGNKRHETDVHEFGYGSRLLLDRVEGDPADEKEVAATPWQEVERSFGVRFDTLLIDCEGCVEYFLDENPGLLDQVKLVLLEGDMGNYKEFKPEFCKGSGGCLEYESVLKRFEAAGFHIVQELCEPGYFLCHWAMKRV